MWTPCFLSDNNNAIFPKEMGEVILKKWLQGFQTEKSHNFHLLIPYSFKTIWYWVLILTVHLISTITMMPPPFFLEKAALHD